MSNAILGYRNRSPDGTFSGGSWEATLPLTNLKDIQPSKVARSTNLALASTKFNLDLGSAKLVRALALVNHNLSLTARVRVRLSETDATLATSDYDSGWDAAWPAVYASYDLDWEAENFWSGTYTEDERSGYQWVYPLILPSVLSARYALIEIDDLTSATTTYAQVGGLFIGEAWSLTVNMSYGASLAWEANTDIQTAISGAEYFSRQTPYRVMRFKSDFMSENEGLSKALEIQRRMGVDLDVLFVHDPDDTIHMLRRSFLGRIRQLGALEYPYLSITSMAWEIKERI